MTARPPRLEALDAIEAGVWHELATAAADSAHEWRHAVLATAQVDAAGVPSGDARTVVLREVDRDERQLVVYTDVRAAKVGQLRRHPAGTLLFWSRSLGWQVRASVVCDIVDEGLAVSSRWARIRQSAAAQDYLAPHAPGTVIETPRLPTLVPALAHREFFAMITARVTRLDWLELAPAGHRRAQFADGSACWVQA